MDHLSRGVEHVDGAATLSIEHFCDEYLGQPGVAVPFGGRAEAMACLDAFLDAPDASCLLLAAPAGMGKSALLTRWAHGLLQRPDLAVAFMPVSLRFETSLARTVFRALAGRLSHLYDAPLDLTRDPPTAWWRGKVEEMLAMPLPDGRRLVVVIDGVDEATESLLSETLFPPSGSARVVVSVRDRAGDEEGYSTLRALGWSDSPRVRRLLLAALSADGLREVMRDLHFDDALDPAAALHRLTGGDPFLVRLYADDLRRGNDARFHAPDSLREGLSGYFEDWWRDHETQSGERASTWTRIVLDLLAVAHGPLMLDDLVELTAGALEPDAQEPARALAQLSRFIVGDGVRSGFCLAHPRLNNWLREEQMTPAQRAETEQKFLDWGDRTLRALNADSESEKVSVYLLRWYALHLLRAEAPHERFVELLRAPWRKASLTRTGDLEVFFNSVEHAWERARSSGPELLGLQWRWALMLGSMTTVENNVPMELLLRMQETGFFTEAQLVAVVRRRRDSATLIAAIAPKVSAATLRQLENLVGQRWNGPWACAQLALALRTPEETRAERFQRVMLEAESEFSEVCGHLSHLFHMLSREEQRRAAPVLFERLVGPDQWYVEHLGPVLDTLSLETEQIRALIEFPPRNRAIFMPWLAKYFSAEEQQANWRALLREVNALNPYSREEASAQLARHAPVWFLEALRQGTPESSRVHRELDLRAMSDAQRFEKLMSLPGSPEADEHLVRLLPVLSPVQVTAVFRRFKSNGLGINWQRMNFVAVLRFVPVELIPKALAGESQVRDQGDARKAIYALRLRAASEEELCAMVRDCATEFVEQQDELLRFAATALPPDRLPLVLACLGKRPWKSDGELRVAAAVAARIPESHRARALEIALEQAMGVSLVSAWSPLELLEPNLSTAALAPLRQRMEDEYRDMRGDSHRVIYCLQLAEKSPPNEQPRRWELALSLMNGLSGGYWRSAMDHLCSSHPERYVAQLDEILESADSNELQLSWYAKILGLLNEDRWRAARARIERELASCEPIARLNWLYPLVALLPEGRDSDLVEQFFALQTQHPEAMEYCRENYVPRGATESFLLRLLPWASRLSDPYCRADALCTLLTSLPERYQEPWIEPTLNALRSGNDGFPYLFDPDPYGVALQTQLFGLVQRRELRRTDLSTLARFLRAFEKRSLPTRPVWDEILAVVACEDRSWSFNVLWLDAHSLYAVGGRRAMQDALDGVRDVTAMWP